jgi:protein-tyrosine phosphatase
MTDRPASARPYRICFVCTGNICRSPMAEAVMRGLLEAEGLEHAVEVDSAGTISWHAGDPADRRAVMALRDAGYDGSTHRARMFERSWLADRDLVVALDAGHLDELRALAGDGPHAPKVRLLRSFIQGVNEEVDDLDVADPYYGGPADFERVLEQVEEGCHGILASLVRDGAVQPV